MRTVVEKVVIIEVGQTVHLRLFVFEMNVSRNSFRVNLHLADLFAQLGLILFQGLNIALVASSQNYF